MSKPIDIDTPANRAKLTVEALRNPCLEKRNAHPLVQQLKARRKKAITAMIKSLAVVISSDAERGAVADDMMHLWPASFFRAAAQQGVTMEVRIHFYRAYDPCCLELNAGVKCQMTLDAESFAGCEPLPLEVELANDIPSEEP